MKSIALLSWRVIAEIVMADKPEWLKWLEDQQRSSSLLVSQFSLIKASSFIQKKLSAGPINPNGLLERFVRRHLLPHNVIDARASPQRSTMNWQLGAEKKILSSSRFVSRYKIVTNIFVGVRTKWI